jgi:hypothetical protein
LSRCDQRFPATEQFVVDWAEFIQPLLPLGVSGDTLTGWVNLAGGLKQQRLPPAFSKATVEIKEGAVLGAPGVAAAVGFAALEVALDEGALEQLGGKMKGA